jgi:hypothetical protein
MLSSSNFPTNELEIQRLLHKLLCIVTTLKQRMSAMADAASDTSQTSSGRAMLFPATARMCVSVFYVLRRHWDNLRGCKA